MMSSCKILSSPREHQVMGNLGEPKLKAGVKRMRSEAGFSSPYQIMETYQEAKQSLNSIFELMEQVHTLKERLKGIVSFGEEDENIFDSVLSRIEAFVILLMDLNRRTSLMDCLCPILQYVKTLGGSRVIVKEIMEGIQKVLDYQGLQAEAGWAECELSSFLKGPFGQRITQVLNLLLMYGIIDKVKPGSRWKKEMFSLFNVGWERHKNSPSLMVFILQTIDWIFECIIPAIKTGNWHLLISTKDVADMDEAYTLVLKLCSMHDSGMHERLEEMGYKTEASLLVKILETVASHKTYLTSLQKQSGKDAEILKTRCISRIVQLEQLSIDLECMWKKKPLRVKPAGFLIAGPSDQAKSSVANIINHAVCRRMGFDEGKEYMVMINAMDKYQSNFRSHHVSAIFDDMCNTRPEREETNPLFVVIQFINNMHADALSPIAELKGKMAILCKVVIITTNKEDLGAGYFSVEPASILRRFWMVVRVKLKENVKDDLGQIKNDYVGLSMPDMWEVECVRHLVMPGFNGPSAPSSTREVVLAKGTMVDLIDYIDQNIAEYYETQEKLVNSASNLHEETHCHLHNLFTLPCIKCKALERQALLPEAGLDWFRFGRRDQESDAMPAAGEDHEQVNIVPSVKERLMMRLTEFHAFPREHLEGLRSHICGKCHIIVGCSVVAGLLAIALSGWRMQHPQGGLLTKLEKKAQTPKQLAEGDDCWKKVYTNSYSYPKASKGMTMRDFEQKIDLNLHIALMTHYKKNGDEIFNTRKYCNMIPIRDGWWLMPWHCAKYDRTEVELRVKAPEILGVRSMKAIVDASNRVRIPGKDLALVDLGCCGDTYDFFRFIQEEEVELPKQLRLYYRKKESIEELSSAEPSDDPITVPVLFKNREYVYGEGWYDLTTYEFQSYEGFCGAIAVLPGRHPTIYGVHSAGNGEKGSCTVLTQKELLPLMARERIRIKESSPLPGVVQMKEHTVVPEIHSKNPLCYVPVDEAHSCQIFGSHTGETATFRTDVIDSPLRAHFEEKLGLCEYTAPLKKMARPARRIDMLAVTEVLPPAEPRFVKKAVDDYLAKIDLFLDGSDFLDYVHTLTLGDALNGVAGVKGFDPINPKTSMSYPWDCPKWKLFTRNVLAEALGVESVKILKKKTLEDGKIVYEYCLEFDKSKFDPEQSVESIVEAFLNNERANVIFKTNLKSEPVKFEKIAANKLRVFAGAPVDFVIITRMIFLPLVVAMTYYPAIFESAVGVNAHGKDWEYIWKIITKYGKDRVIAGDFSKFDKKVRPEFLLGAFQILKHILYRAGVSEDVLSIIDGVATETTFPIYEVDGVLAQVIGSSPSGHSLTVVVNGLVVSLMLRYVYYSLHDTAIVPLFHEVVSLVTYGDDNTCSVHEDEPLFNQQTIELVLKRIGVVYTSADKSVIEEPFTSAEECEFLKRSFIFRDDFGGCVAPLQMESIKKMLCVTKKMKGDVCQAEIVAASWMSALAEAAFHGPECYEKIWEAIKCVVNERDSEGNRYCDYFTMLSYEEAIQRFQASESHYDMLRMPDSLKPESGDYDLILPVFENEIGYEGIPSDVPYVPRRLDDMHFELLIAASEYKARVEMKYVFSKYLKAFLCKRLDDILLVSAEDYGVFRMLQKRQRCINFVFEDAFSKVWEYVEGEYFYLPMECLLPDCTVGALPDMFVSPRVYKMELGWLMQSAALCSPYLIYLCLPTMKDAIDDMAEVYYETGMYNDVVVCDKLYWFANYNTIVWHSIVEYIEFLVRSRLYVNMFVDGFCGEEYQPLTVNYLEPCNFEPGGEWKVWLGLFVRCLGYICCLVYMSLFDLHFVLPTPRQMSWLCLMFWAFHGHYLLFDFVHTYIVYLYLKYVRIGFCWLHADLCESSSRPKNPRRGNNTRRAEFS